MLSLCYSLTKEIPVFRADEETSDGFLDNDASMSALEVPEAVEGCEDIGGCFYFYELPPG